MSQFSRARTRSLIALTKLIMPTLHARAPLRLLLIAAIACDTPPREEPSSRVPTSGEEVCSAIELAGNGTPGKTQRCEFVAPVGVLPEYRLTIRGDYGDDGLLVAVLLVEELSRLDDGAHTSASVVNLVFPDPGAALEGTTHVPLMEVRSCRAEGDRSDRRMCLIKTVAKKR